MKTIHKYEYKLGLVKASLPKNARIVKVAIIEYNLVLWAEVQLPTIYEERMFLSVGTGENLNLLYPEYRKRHIETVVSSEYIWHIYEILKPEQNEQYYSKTA